MTNDTRNNTRTYTCHLSSLIYSSGTSHHTTSLSIQSIKGTTAFTLAAPEEDVVSNLRLLNLRTFEWRDLTHQIEWIPTGLTFPSHVNSANGRNVYVSSHQQNNFINTSTTTSTHPTMDIQTTTTSSSSSISSHTTTTTNRGSHGVGGRFCASCAMVLDGNVMVVFGGTNCRSSSRSVSANLSEVVVLDFSCLLPSLLSPSSSSSSSSSSPSSSSQRSMTYSEFAVNYADIHHSHDPRFDQRIYGQVTPLPSTAYILYPSYIFSYPCPLFLIYTRHT